MAHANALLPATRPRFTLWDISSGGSESIMIVSRDQFRHQYDQIVNRLHLAMPDARLMVHKKQGLGPQSNITKRLDLLSEQLLGSHSRTGMGRRDSDSLAEVLATQQ